MKKVYAWMLAGAIICGISSSTTAQNTAGNYEDLMKLLPEETFLWVATRDLEKGFREVAPRLGEKLDRSLIRMLPSQAQDSNATNFVAALTAMGVKTDGTAAIGMLILPDKNGRIRMSEMVVVLPIGSQDALEAAIQSESRDNPPRQNLGGITVVGSDSNRFNCAWTDKYFVFGTRPCVALVAETFLGKHRSVAKAPPGDGLFLLHFNPGQLSGTFKKEVMREIESRSREDAGSLLPSALQSLEIMRACDGFTIFADLAGNRLAFKGRLGLQNTPALARLLSAKPETLSILQCLPADAPLVAATCLTPELLPIWAGFMGSFLDDAPQLIAAFSQLARPMAGRQIAFAFTQGSFGTALPNILCVADCRDPEAAQAGCEALSSLCISKFRKPFTIEQMDGTELRTFKTRDDSAMFAARSEKRLFFATDSDAIRKVIVQAAQGGGKSAEDIQEIAELLGPEKKSSLLVFADFPRIFSAMAEARRDKTVKSQQQYCANSMREAERLANLYQEKLGRAPTDLPGMLPALAEIGVKNQHLQTNCVSDTKAPLILDPTTRKVTCPHHGMVNQPRAYVSPETARPHRDAFQRVDLLGRGAVRLSSSPTGFDIEGKLNLNPYKPPEPVFSCINNLRMMDSAKEQWALENRKSKGDQADIPGVNRYIKGNSTPICPAGGTYTYNPIGVAPACSVPEHSLR